MLGIDEMIKCSIRRRSCRASCTRLRCSLSSSNRRADIASARALPHALLKLLVHAAQRVLGTLPLRDVIQHDHKPHHVPGIADEGGSLET